MKTHREIPCGGCGGTGHITKKDIEGENVEVVCPACDGRGYLLWEIWKPAGVNK